LELRDIDYFLAVAGERSMRAAAKRLGLTQPALSKAIRRLEEEVGAQLLDRDARGVALTVYGRSFLRHARFLKAEMTEAAFEIQALAAGTAGLVRLGAGPRWQQWLLPEAIRRFREAHPQVQLVVVGGTDDVLKEELSAGALDFIVASIPQGTEFPALEGEGFVTDEYRVVGDIDHPLRRKAAPVLADLLDYPWVLPNPKTYLMAQFEAILRAHGLSPPRPIVETDLPTMRFALMRGTAFLSVHILGQLRAFNESQILPIEVAEARWQRASGLIRRRGVEPNPAAEALMRIVEDLAIRERAQGAGMELFPAA
jgi:DNA-binding transcriptional LysR family regulator